MREQVPVVPPSAASAATCAALLAFVAVAGSIRCSNKAPHHPTLPSRPCRDAEHGEREGDPRPRYAEQLVSGWVDYVRLDTPQSVYTALNKLWAHQPVLLRGAPLATGLVGRWSFQQLVRPLGAKWGATDATELAQ